MINYYYVKLQLSVSAFSIMYCYMMPIKQDRPLLESNRKHIFGKKYVNI